ncbi:hypothetical protein HYT05_03995 [Candidatus Kaiserbacteria bacterium]|nr:hypothetical protein [Candidatus Kaiserbacteria bacterium]
MNTRTFFSFAPIKFVLWSLLFFVIADPAYAATLALPQQEPRAVGETFAVPVYISTKAGESINAVQGTLTYPTDKLQVLSVEKEGIIDFWIADPVFSNTNGTVSFEGIAHNPGFAGQNGQALSIRFKALAAGMVSLAFESASVLANDGQGTNVLTDAPGVSMTLTGLTPVATAPVTSAAPAETPKNGPAAGEISSPTHPDPTQWYSSKDVRLVWTNPRDVTAVRVTADKILSSVPTKLYEPPISSKNLSLDDGVWYFHVQARGAKGWGTVSHFKIQIDSTPPDPMHIMFPHGSTTTDPRPVALFNTTDDLSGIDFYTVTVNGYALPTQDPGDGKLLVVAHDKAGNTTTSQADFTITGLDAPALDMVEDLTAGDILEISGTTYPNARIDVFLRDKDGDVASQWTRTTPSGDFRIIWTKRLDAGVYSITAQSTIDTGAKTAISPRIDFQIKESAIFKMSWLVINYLSLGLLFVALVTSFALGGWYLYERIRVFKHLSSWFGHVQHMCKQCSVMRQTAGEEIASLESIRAQRVLTPEEEKLMGHLQRIIEKTDAAKNAPTCPPEV